jgi:peptidoglycan LD-endopeptidase LytH
MKKRSVIKTVAIVLALGLLLPARGVIPVQNATPKDWDAHSYWFSPWGKSGVHKGIDIFAKRSTPVITSTSGIIIYTGNISMGGNIVAILGPKWRIYYYAHLDAVNAKTFDWADQGKVIGKVGNSGNAKGKPPHLHYSILSLIPYPWQLSLQTQGYKKMFFMNPADNF